MGSVRVPILNPIRFYRDDQAPDYDTYWPNPDNVTQRIEWQKGINPVQFYKDWVKDKTLTFQFRIIPTVTNQTIKVYKYNETTLIYDLNTTLNPTDITPDAFTSESVNQYIWTPSLSGTYYFDFEEVNFTSDVIAVHESSKFLKRLVQITYSNDRNDYGMIYYSDEGDPGNFTQRFTGEIYFTGYFQPGEPSNEVSVFNRDRGGVVQTRATPLNTYELVLSDIHHTQNQMINHMFSNNDITVNGISCQNSEAPVLERIEKSDVNDLTIQLTETENDYFINQQ